MTPRDHTPSFDHFIAASNLPRAEARQLLAHITGRPLTWFIAHGDDAVAPDTAAAFEALAARRRAGEPLAYLLGEQAFYGRQFGVSPAVLIPRADTETLIEAALEKRRMMGIGPVILELGSGSGIIAITLALEIPEAVVHAIERSPEAMAVAQKNANALGARDIRWHLGSWWDALSTPPAPDTGNDTHAAAPASGAPEVTAPAPDAMRPASHSFDLIVSNPPYIASGDHHLREGDLRFEPSQALAAGADGLDDLRILIDGAPCWLKPGGWLLLEHGYDQGTAVRQLLEARGFAAVFTRQDLGGNDRVSGGMLPTVP